MVGNPLRIVTMFESDVGVAFDTTANIILTQQGSIYTFSFYNGDVTLGTEMINLGTDSVHLEVISNFAVVTHPSCVSVVDLQSLAVKKVTPGGQIIRAVLWGEYIFSSSTKGEYLMTAIHTNVSRLVGTAAQSVSFTMLYDNLVYVNGS